MVHFPDPIRTNRSHVVVPTEQPFSRLLFAAWFAVRTTLGLGLIAFGLLWLIEGYRISDLNRAGWVPNLLFTGLYLCYVGFVARTFWRKEFKLLSEFIDCHR